MPSEPHSYITTKEKGEETGAGEGRRGKIVVCWLLNVPATG